MKRRIIYKEKSNKETEIICIELADKLEDVQIKVLDLDYEQDKDKFDRVKRMHVENGQVIFDELYPSLDRTEIIKLEQEKQELENQLLVQADKNLDGGIL
ncbi:hypothetical protein RBU49_11545 [Clostridium sp. MB40-C1]|uniref:hypothetical protein n=1 Tax=Clostridium sp. MB40-C1 TaxID=3070996 RepID=UPI0027E11A5E|nr:hypothetical protein [Clostridium sp. MB40-C1]WMJ79523.1 hypothetical protein RBU49_11545 [Clostridium sp. MB40-C1]